MGTGKLRGKPDSCCTSCVCTSSSTAVGTADTDTPRFSRCTLSSLRKPRLKPELSATVTWMGYSPSGQEAIFSATRPATSPASTSQWCTARAFFWPVAG